MVPGWALWEDVTGNMRAVCTISLTALDKYKQAIYTRKMMRRSAYFRKGTEKGDQARITTKGNSLYQNIPEAETDHELFSIDTFYLTL